MNSCSYEFCVSCPDPSRHFPHPALSVCTAKAASLTRQSTTPVRGHAPAGSVAMAAMNLFTLEFERSGIEAAYVADRFARTSGAVIVVSAVNIALHTILTIQARSCS